jgi:hypothetical protein
MGKGIGLRNSVYGILGLLVIARKHGIISLLYPDLKSTVFISQQLKHVKVFILLFK